MQKSQSVSESLQTLQAKGYHLAETFADQPEGPSQPHDWRLDSVQKVQEEDGYALLVAVSSACRSRKLVFIESAPSNASFSPVTLLRKLFPKQTR